MKRLILAVLALACVASPALAGNNVSSSITADAPSGKLPAQGSYCSADLGVTWLPCTGGGGGGGGGGDASSANQSTQITAANLSNTRLGDISSPATGSVNFRLNQIYTGLSPLSSIDTKLSAATPAGELHIGEVGGRSVVTGGTFTTPAGTTAYASGNLIANSATAGSVTPVSITACRVNTGSGMIRRIRYTTTDTGFAGATVRVHLYRDNPTASNGDHAAWLTTQSTYIGAFDVALDRHFTDAEKGVGGPLVGGEANFDCASGTNTLFALVEARGAVTPQGAKVHTIAAEIIQN